MGWPNPPGTIRWIDLLAVSTKGDNLAIVYFGLPPLQVNRISLCACIHLICLTLATNRIWEEDYAHKITEDGAGQGPACTFVDLAQKPNFNFSVSLPSLTALPAAGIDTGITILGEEVYLDRTSGWMIVEGSNYTVTPIR